MKIQLLVVALLAISSFSDETKQFNNELIGNLGWGNPNGMSIEYMRHITTSNAISAGIGISMAGMKYGFGYKYYFNEAETFSPFLGISASQAAGLSKVNVNVNADSSVYSVNSGSAVTPRGGLRFQKNAIRLQLNLGYGLTMTGGGVEYVSGSKLSSVQSLAKAMGVGGVEISGSASICF